MKSYKWKMSGFSKKIDPNKAVKELQKISKKYGELTPEIIVQESIEPKSVLHNYFEWDNDKAANQWRIQQARMLLNNIEVEVISDGEKYNVPVYEIVNKSGYSHITTFTVDEMEVVRQTALKDLSYIKNKLALYGKFIEAGEHITLAIDSLQKS